MNLWWIGGEGLLVSVAGWLGWRSMSPRASGLIENWLGWGIVGTAIVVVAGVVLGAIGQLGAVGYLSLHSLLLLFLVLHRRKSIRQDREKLRQLCDETIIAACAQRLAMVGTLSLGLFLTITGVMAAMAEPVVYDALTYRLSRIGHWLQEGQVSFLVTSDPRQNYMPVVPDLVMAWLIAGGDTGWRPVALAQWWGGVLFLVATVGLARAHGLGRNASLGTAMLCAGLANVAPQFTTPHTDLLTAGFVAATLWLWVCAAARREGSWVAGLAAGLALGAKGTVFYFLPVLALWMAWQGWRSHLPLRAWGATAAAVIVATLWFASPGWWQNQHHYGNGFGPPEFVAMHHQGGGIRLVEKTGLNLATAMVQNFEPHSQPPGLSEPAAKWGEMLARWLPVNDIFTYEGLNRQETILALLARTTPDADVLAFGLIVPALFLTGWAMSLAGNRPHAAEIRWLGGGVLGFLVIFHAMQQWHPYAYRYFLLVAPWLTVVAAWGVAGLPRRMQSVVWILALGSAASVGTQTLMRAHQAGWMAVTKPEGSRGNFVAANWARWAQTLDQPGEPLRLALPFNLPLAGFYRNGTHRIVRPAELERLQGLTAQEAVDRLGSGWLIVPAVTFLGREGAVHGRVWLQAGNPEDVFSLAAYRALAQAEIEPAIIYRHLVGRESNSQRHDLLVRTGLTGNATIVISAHQSGRGQIASPQGLRTVEWQKPGAKIVLQLPPRQVAEVIVMLNLDAESAGSAAMARVEVY